MLKSLECVPEAVVYQCDFKLPTDTRRSFSSIGVDLGLWGRSTQEIVDTNRTLERKFIENVPIQSDLIHCYPDQQLLERGDFAHKDLRDGLASLKNGLVAGAVKKVVGESKWVEHREAFDIHIQDGRIAVVYARGISSRGQRQWLARGWEQQVEVSKLLEELSDAQAEPYRAIVLHINNPDRVTLRRGLRNTPVFYVRGMLDSNRKSPQRMLLNPGH